MGWIYIENAETGGTAHISDEPGVLDWYKGRGWERADEPEQVPFVPAKGTPPPEDEWVELVHPESGGKHDFPNISEALQGAYEAGWRVSKPEKPAKATKKTANVKASAEPATDDNEVKE